MNEQGDLHKLTVALEAAEREGDEPRLRELLDPEVRIRSSDGRVATLEEFLHDLRDPKRRRGVLDAVVESVSIARDQAVVVVRVRVEGSQVGGKPGGVFREIRVYEADLGGAWRVVMWSAHRVGNLLDVVRDQDRRQELLRRGRARRSVLAEHYRDVSEFGLVLGAGVSVESSVPDYRDFVLVLLESVLRGGGDESPSWAWDFLALQRRRGAEGEALAPDVVAMLARLLVRNPNERSLPRASLAEALWGGARSRDLVTGPAARNRYARKGSWAENDTLNAVITMCSVLQDGQPRANPKIGAVLTTNYDNLVEAACRAKYRTVELLKPVARTTSAEGERDYRQIPVYHVHGYLSYREREPHGSDPPLVIEESDYFDVFYDTLGFGNYMAMAFFRRYPALFIGSAMSDKNIRRLLHRLASDSDTGALPNPAFALLRAPEKPDDVVAAFVTDEVLHAYGVETIWMEGFSEVPDVLMQAYASNGDPADMEHSWRYLWAYNAYAR